MEQTSMILRMAKLWSVISMGFILVFMVGYGLDPNEPLPTPREWFELGLFPIGVLVGMILSWKYAGAGALISIVCLVSFYFVEYAFKGRFPGGLYFLIVTAPAFFFLAYSTMTHKRS